MDINTINKIVKERYNCMVVSIFKYENTNFIKGLESLKNSIRYRYFKIEKDKIVEILDENILNYFREKNEIHEDVNY
ncbi:MAG: hypothetical protein IKF38_03800 [Clostridia bacterium]|nr:hypothetical protein [Clostridia bacterium]